MNIFKSAQTFTEVLWFVIANYDINIFREENNNNGWIRDYDVIGDK